MNYLLRIFFGIHSSEMILSNVTMARLWGNSQILGKLPLNCLQKWFSAVDLEAAEEQSPAEALTESGLAYRRICDQALFNFSFTSASSAICPNLLHYP